MEIVDDEHDGNSDNSDKSTTKRNILQLQLRMEFIQHLAELSDIEILSVIQNKKTKLHMLKVSKSSYVDLWIYFDGF